MIAPIVDAAFVVANPHVVVVDVRWFLDGRSGRAAFEAGHLPGAVWVDLDADLAAHGLPAREGRHPFPEPDRFAAAMERLGIGDDTVVVAYDNSGFPACRLVVMLRMVGVSAAVLDGGLAAWPGTLETGEAQQRPPGRFTPRPWPADRLASADELIDADVVIDARAPGRFAGEQNDLDPRPGHVPGACNLPWQSVLDRDGRFLDPDRLRERFTDVGLGAGTDAVTYCGSGVSACVNVLAAEYAGVPVPRLYVASWSGWSSDPDRPVARGH